MNGLFRGKERGCIVSGGRRKAWTWRGEMIEQREDMDGEDAQCKGRTSQEEMTGQE